MDANGAVRGFQRTFTCMQTNTGVLVICDHIMIVNATDAQVLNMTRPTAPPPISTTATSSLQAMESQNGTDPSIEAQNQMVQKFSQQSGMNIEFSKLCLKENNWNYEKAGQTFMDLKQKNAIPPEAFVKP